MKDKLTLLLMGLLCAFFSSAQEVTGQLKGDSGSIQYANVVLFNYGDSSVIISVASAEDGSFSLKINEKDSVFIESFYTGFKSFSSKPLVGAKQSGEIRLEGDTKLDTLTITFKKPFQEISAHGTTFNVNGNIRLTEKWKIGFRSGYDFDTKEISYSSIDVYRDLHCWEMRFNWVPFGFRQSFNLSISVKSSILQDLKLNKRKSFYDF